jgi:hypothetical protein
MKKRIERDLRDFLNRPDIVSFEAERLVSTSSHKEGIDEASWRDSALRLHAERLRTEKRLRAHERSLRETEWDPKDYRETGFPVLSCMSTSTRKRIDQLPKANEMVASLIPSIEANITSQPSNTIYKSLRKIRRERYLQQDEKEEDKDMHFRSMRTRRNRTNIRPRVKRSPKYNKERKKQFKHTSTATLEHLHQESINREKNLKSEIVKQMSSIMQTTLPRNMIQRATNDRIRRHHFQKFVKIMEDVIRSFSLKELNHTFGIWQEFVQLHRDQERVKSALRIQRAWWRSVARFELNTRRELRDRQEAEARRLIAERNLAASTIQRAYRTCLAKSLTTLLREIRDLRDRSVRVLQRSYRCYQGRVELERLRSIRDRRIDAVTTIAKYFRGWLGRRKGRVKRTLKKVQDKEEERIRQVEEMRQKFERHGAAIALQVWYKGMLHRALMRRRIRAREWRAAKSIQRRYRSYRIRLNFLIKKRAAKRIQERMRVFHEMIRLREMRKEILTMKQKRKEKKREILKKRKEMVNFMGLKITKGQLLNAKHSLLNPFSTLKNTKVFRERAAHSIQCAFRQHAARAHVRRIRMRNRHEIREKKRQSRIHAAVMLQKYYRGWQLRKDELKRRLNQSAAKIQVHWRVHNNTRRKQACVKIQKHWRGRIRRKRFEMLISQRLQFGSYVTKICALYRGYRTRKILRLRRERKIEIETLKKRGKEDLIKTKIKLREMIVLESLRSRRVTRRTDLQGVFVALSSSEEERKKDDEGIKSSSSSSSFHYRLNGSGFKTFCKLARDLMVDLNISNKKNKKRQRRGFDMNELDLLFVKHKTKGERSLSYREFVSLLKEMASKMYLHVNEYKAGTRGVEARVYMFLDTHILLSDVSYSEEPLRELDREADRRIQAATCIITRAWLLYNGKSVQSLARAAKESYLVRKREIAYASKIQRLFRIRMAKRKMIVALNRVYVKYVDPKSGQPFYCNKLTGEKSWYKPLLLRLCKNGDLDESFELPQRDTEFVVKCANCNDDVNDTSNPEDRLRCAANVCCEQCEEPLCSDCFKQLHRSGHRKNHIATPIKYCGHCEFQAATRHCLPCSAVKKEKGYMCDNCYLNEHKHRTHVWKPLVVMCSECETYACRWWCEDCKDPFCTPCFERSHARGHRAVC